MEQEQRNDQEQTETAEVTPKRGVSSTKRILCIIICLALLAAAILVWCKVWNGKGAQALSQKDLPAAADAFSKDFLFGGSAQAALIAQADEAFRRGAWEEAADRYAQLGEGGHDRWVDCIHQLSEQACEQGKYTAAVEYAEQIGEEKQDVWNRAKAALGQEAFDRKEYALAEELFAEAGELGKDGWADVQVAFGDEAFAAKEYVQAAAYYEKAGEKGSSLLANAYYEEGLRLIKVEQPEKAIEYLSKIGDESRAQQQIGLAQFMIAQNLFQAEKFDQAIEAAQAIENASLVDVPTFLQAAYYQYAKQQFAQDDLKKALEHFEKCPDNENAQTNAAILGSLVKENNTLAAARLAVTACEAGQTDVSLAAWRDTISKRLELYSTDDLNRDLRLEATKIVLAEALPFEQREELLKNSVPSGEFLGKFSQSDETYFVIESMDALYRGDYGELGTEPAGKCLIVIDRGYYTTRSYAVAMCLMRCLPPELIPGSLAEVEYVVLIQYDHTLAGRYRNGLTSAYREKGMVEMYQLPKKAKTYTSPTVQGDPPPQTISYYGLPPVSKTGGAPNMGEALFTALSRIYK